MSNWQSPMEQSPMELWGGVECTINRVGDRFHDQYARTGHRDRVREDLELFAELGLRTLRTALHWERCDDRQTHALWDHTLRSMDELGVRPIVGLLHHGSKFRGLFNVEEGYLSVFSDGFEGVFKPGGENGLSGGFEFRDRHAPGLEL